MMTKKELQESLILLFLSMVLSILITGSTTLSLALELKNLSGYTIITNSIPVLTTFD